MLRTPNLAFGGATCEGSRIGWFGRPATGGRVWARPLLRLSTAIVASPATRAIITTPTIPPCSGWKRKTSTNTPNQTTAWITVSPNSDVTIVSYEVRE